MDITILFKACVKTVRTTNKDLGVPNAKSNILKSRKDENMMKPREIFKHLTNLHSFFEENKVEYLNVMNYMSGKKSMSEMDREQIDTVAQKVLNTCATMIKEYRQELGKLKLSPQKVEHYSNVLEFISCYLKDVSRLHSNARAARIKRIIENTKISKLEGRLSNEKSNKENLELNKKNLDFDKKNLEFNKTNLHFNRTNLEHDKKLELIKDNSNLKDNSLTKTKRDVKEVKPAFHPEQSLPFDDSILSAEEMQMFEAENELLYNELNSLADEVKQMESKVVHIAELQELFTEKVLQQEKDIDRIAHVVANTTDDVKDANEQIRQAIQRNAGLRVWVLFFLLVMSMSLLFLDWYND